MTVLSKIRNRAGLLVAVVGIALLIFVLQAALESGTFLFGNSNRYAGEIGGNKIGIEDYSNRLEDAMNKYMVGNPQGTLDDQTRDMLNNQTWQRLISDIVMGSEYKELGITVSDDELLEDMLGEDPHQAVKTYFTDRNTGKIYDQYADPRTGQLNMVAVRRYVESFGSEKADPSAESSWIMLENYVRETKLNEKYNNLIKKGLYVTTSQAKREFVDENRKMDIRYVVKRYASVPDSAITVEESDIVKYYNEHQSEFKVPETTRKIEYVTFEAVPSEDDLKALRESMEQLKADFREAENDSAFVMREADTRMFSGAYVTKDMLTPSTDTLFNAAPGTVIGPYIEGQSMKISKLVKTKVSADSARVRHILIGYQGVSQTSAKTKEQAKAFADSLVTLVKSGKAKFTELVDKHSEDPGKAGEEGKGKGGDYGWMNAQSPFVEPYKDAGLDNKKGDILVVESQFGFHVIEVLDRSKTETKKVQIATIDRVIEPSTRTMQAYLQQASEFARKNNTSELFTMAVDKENLNKRIADNIRESDRTIPGLEQPAELVRWIYDAEKGAVSEPFDFGNKFVVAHLTGIKEKGIAPLEEVRDQAAEGAKRTKKAEKFISDFNAAMAGTTNIDDVAKKMSETAADASNITFSMYAIPGVGNEGAVLGTVSAMKANALSKPIEGNSGVFVVYLKKVQEPTLPADLTEQRKKSANSVSMRVDYEVFEALKENANIIDNRAKNMIR
jgi:peptidyl-prolyl cis-trans isomerase D